MSDLESIAFLLEQSLNPATSKQAEQSLRSQESNQGFSLSLLHVVASANLPISSRLAAALFFKNFIKRKWVDENGNYLIQDTDLIKSEIIPLMISLPNNLQIQIGEAISVIADSDFPERWPSLIDDLVNKLSEDDMVTNIGVLTVAHSIFKRWRPLFRSDALFLEIKLVLEKFSVPFLNLLKKVDGLIDSNSTNKAQLAILFDVLLLLVKIYFDLNCQDLPEFFEDHMNEGMSIIHKYLIYSNDLSKPEDDDSDDIEVVSKVKTAISELIQLYTTRYEEEFDALIPQFVQSTWNLLTTTGLQSRYDILVSKLLSFLTSVAKLPKHSEIFNNETALKEITERIIIPNLTVRESDEELFEDDPIEYIRRDLEGSDSDTRRRASIDFLRELKSKNESLVTQVVLGYINHYLSKYQAEPTNWKFKDLTLYLFTALAAKGSVTSSGISSTNLLLDVVQFFTNNIVSDLLNDNIHPILKVDAIKYIYIFRNQLTKAQLLESFPILTKHLHSTEFVEYTYAAITIERILSIRDENQGLMFNKSDLQPFVQDLLSNLFRLILQNNQTPEKLAENEFLMKTVMRVLVIAEDAIESYSVNILEQLLSIVSIISKNPSNPKFSHFTFESISVLIKYNNKSNLSKFVEIIIPTLLNILGSDVQEFVPYTFQIFAFLLEIQPEGSPLPDTYKQLVQPLLSPSVWEFKGNIPAVTRLLQAIISKDPSVFGELSPLLGVFQKLISSKVNENYGFDLLETIITKFPGNSIDRYTKQIAILLLQRLQSSRTEKFVKKLIIFISKLTIIKSSAEYAINFIEQVQSGIFGTIYEQFLLPSVVNIGNLLDKKIVVIGLTNLTTSSVFINGDYTKLLIPTFECLTKIITSESIFNIKGDHEEVLDLELEEISSFGSNFSRLSTISVKPFDPVPSISNLDGGKSYFVESITKLNAESNNGFLNPVKSQLSADAVKGLSSLGL